jgi:hypothetical protein
MLVISGLSIAIFGSYIYLNNGLPQRSVLTKVKYNERVRSQFVGPNWKYSTNDTCLKEYPLNKGYRPAWWFCMKSDSSKPTFIILGTSYANQLYPGFISNQALRHQHFLSIGICDFAASGTEINDINHPCFGKRISEQKQFIDGVVQKNSSINFAIIDGLKRDPDKAYINRLQKRVSDYESKGIKVILFTPHLVPNFHPKSCFDRTKIIAAKDCSFPSSNRQNLYDDFKPVIASLKKTNPNVLIFEQNQIFCKNDKCSYIRNGMPLHRDEYGHLSEYASKELQFYFTEWAKVKVPEIFDINLAGE